MPKGVRGSSVIHAPPRGGAPQGFGVPADMMQAAVRLPPAPDARLRPVASPASDSRSLAPLSISASDLGNVTSIQCGQISGHH